MFSKTNTALLIIALMFIGGCGENLSDYQLRIVKEAESIVSSNNEDGLSAREIKILLTVLYIESVKLKEHNNDGSSYDKLFTTFTHLIPTYQNLVSLENEKQEKNRIESLLKTTDAIISESKLDIKTRIDELEYEVKKLESFKDVLISDAQALYNSLLLITTQTQESPIWAKSKAERYASEFYTLINAVEGDEGDFNKTD